MHNFLKKILFLSILILSLSTFAFATVSNQNENGHTLTVDLSLTIDDVDSLITLFKEKISNLFDTTNNNLIDRYNTIDKYYFLRAYNTKLEDFENLILNKYLSTITADAFITKQNMVVWLQNGTYSSSSGYPKFTFFISNLGYPNGVDSMGYVYFEYGDAQFIKSYNRQNSSFVPQYTVFLISNNNEYSESTTDHFLSNPTRIYFKTSNIDLSVNSSSVIDIPVFATYKPGVIYYKTLNENSYYPYFLKQTFGKTSGGGGDAGGGGDTGGGGDAGGDDNTLVEIKGELITIKGDVATIKDNILTKEKLQEILEKEPTTTKDDFENSFPTVNVDDPTEDFFTWIFNQVENVFTSTTPQTFEFSLYSDTVYKINSDDIKTPSGALKTFVSLSISFSIFYYILKDIRKIINKVKEGNIEELAEEDITANMV